MTNNLKSNSTVNMPDSSIGFINPISNVSNNPDNQVGLSSASDKFLQFSKELTDYVNKHIITVEHKNSILNRLRKNPREILESIDEIERILKVRERMMKTLVKDGVFKKLDDTIAAYSNMDLFDMSLADHEYDYNGNGQPSISSK